MPARRASTTLCAACHGADGKGNSARRAESDRRYLAARRLGCGRARDHHQRPNQSHARALERLGETKVRLLAAYVWSSVAWRHPRCGTATRRRSHEARTPPAVMLVRRGGRACGVVVWTSFLAAAVETMVFFAYFDPDAAVLDDRRRSCSRSGMTAYASASSSSGASPHRLAPHCPRIC